MLAERLITVSDRNYKEFFQKPQLVLMMGLKGAPMCESYRGEIEQVAKKYSQLSFGVTWMNREIDITRFMKEYQEIFDEYFRPPTTVFIKEHKLRGLLESYYQADEIDKEISKVFNIREHRGFLQRLGFR